MNYFMPTRLYTGQGCISSHADALRKLGTTCAIITSGNAAVVSGALGDAQDALASCGISSFVYNKITANPSVSSCIEAGRLAHENGAQFILGIGGGSPLDAAKAIAVFATNPALDEAGFYAMAWEHDPLPIALIGTTAGTGSEVTKVAVLTDGAHRKHSIHDDRLYGAVAFGDSRHTHTCPQPVTLSCGVDVLAHATESYFSRKADEISRAFAVRAIRLALEPLAAAVEGSPSAAQREQLYDASILGGLAINTTGTCFPHNVGYYLTENYDVPHGFACAVFMPAMLDTVRAYDPAYAAAFYDEIGASEEAYVSLVKSCLPDLGIHMAADEISAAVPRWANNGSVKNTRAEVTMEDIRTILTSMFA